MDEGDNIKAVINRVTITKLLIAPIALVLWCAQYCDFKIGIASLIPNPAGEGLIARRIINNQHFYVAGSEGRRDAFKDFLDCPFGVVGNDKDQQFLTCKIDIFLRKRVQLFKTHAFPAARSTPARPRGPSKIGAITNRKS